MRHSWSGSVPLVRPLLGGESIDVVVPDVPGRDVLVALLREEAAELVVELGAELGSFDGMAPGGPDRLEFVIDPSAGVPTLFVDRGARRVEARGASLDDSALALHLLRTARRTGADVERHVPAVTAAEAVERVAIEVETTWPSFTLAEIDWARLSETSRPAPDVVDLVSGLQRWVARLGDAHTNVHVRPGGAALPYTARVTDGRIVFVDIPDRTPLWEAGVRSGDDLLGVDTQELWDKVGATPHLKPLLVGRRALSGLAGEPLELMIRRRDGSTVTVNDTPGRSTWPRPIEHRRLRSGTGYLRIRRWHPDDTDSIDDALTDLDRTERLIVDLRGNPGGTLVAATAFRRRFLSCPTRVGSVRYSVGDGTLSAPAFYDDEPSDERRWTKPVRFITDALTYSASEDALLGLGQLDHVEVVGEPSGGGSGRPRTVPLIGPSFLTVSTALTYDHAGRCIERAGIHVDRPLSVDHDIVTKADTNW